MSFYPLKNKSFKVLTASALFVILGIYFTAGLVWAAPNLQINYQGKLTNASNVAVADAGYQMEFSLYTAPTGGTAVWTETRTGVNEVIVENGLFSVMLGSVNPLTGVDFNQTLYLGVTVEADSEMTPRKVLGAVPAAFEANNANTVGGVASTSLVRNDRIGTIATTSASTILTIIQSGTGDILNLFDGGTEVFSVLDGGNVGIGSTSPSAKLTVVGAGFFGGNLTATGTLNISGTSTLATTTFNGGISLGSALASATTSVARHLDLWGGIYGINITQNAMNYIVPDIGAHNFYGGSTLDMMLSSTGQLGIGTTNPQTRLDVGNGLISGGTFSSTFRNTLNLSGGTMFPAIDFTFPNTGYFRVAEVGILGTNDIFFQALPATTAGYGYLEAWDSAGMVVGTGNSAPVIFRPNRVERMRITSSGTVGIGTTTPQTRLELAGLGALDQVIRLSNTDTTLTIAQQLGGVEFFSMDANDTPGVVAKVAGYSLGTGSNFGNLGFYTGSLSANLSEKMTILSNGNVGIGSTSPSAKLTVVGAGFFGGNLTATGTLAITGSSTLATTTITDLALSGAFRDATNAIGTNGMILQTTGTSTRWVATSTLGLLASAITGIGPAGQLQSGPAITLASSTGSFNGLTIGNTITATGNTITYTPSIIGSLTNAGLATPYLSFATTSAGTDISFSSASSTLGGTVTLNIPNAGPSARGLLTSTDWITFNGKISSTSLDTIAELDNLITDVTGVTGTGSFVLSTSPTFTGTANFASTSNSGRLTVSGTSTLATTTFAGLVGIGTTTPSRQLQITNGTGFATLLVGDESVGQSQIIVARGATTTTGAFYSWSNAGVDQWSVGLDYSNSANNELIFNSNVTNGVLTLQRTGNIGIGSTSPSSKLTVAGNGFFGGNLTAIGTLAISGTSTLATTTISSSTITTLNLVNALSALSGGTGFTTYSTGDFIYASGANTLAKRTIGSTGNVLSVVGGVPTWVATSTLGLSGGSNFFTDAGATTYLTSLSDNLAIGTNTGSDRLTVNGNINLLGGTAAINWEGNKVLSASTTQNNYFFGYQAGENVTTGSGIIAIGWQALQNATSSNNNIAIGSEAGINTTSGDANVFIGPAFTGTSNTTGGRNVFIGQLAGVSNVTGGSNNLIGYAGGHGIRSGDGNNAYGSYTGFNLSTSSDSVLIGDSAGFGDGGTYEANNLTLIGRDAGYNLQTGANNNIILGYSAGSDLTTGANNLLIGYNVEAPSNTGDNQLNIGNLIFGTGIDGTGTTLSSGNIGIGSTSPSSKLTVAGTFRATGTSTLATTTITRLALAGALLDSTNASGTLGMVLQSTGTSTRWVATSTLGITGGSSLFTDGGATTYLTSLTDNLAIGTTTGSSRLTVNGAINVLGSSAGISFDGTSILRASTTRNNYMFGEGAGASYLTGSNNIGLGLNALTNSTDSTGNIAIGTNAGQAVTSGSDNVFIGGAFTGYSNTTGTDNIFIGYAAGGNNTTGGGNVMIGNSAANALRSGNDNTVYGRFAAQSLATSSDSTIIGHGAAWGISGDYQASRLTILGREAGYNLQTGADNNILIGYNAADNLTTGANNLIIGYDIDAASTTRSNQLNIGNLIFSNGIDGTGTTLSTGNIGIGSSSPSARLTVSGAGFFGGNLTATGTLAISGTSTLATTTITRLALAGALLDSTNASGTLGMVLQSTGTSTRWVATSTLGLGGGSSLFTDGGATTYLTSVGDNLAIGTSTAFTSGRLLVAGDVAINRGSAYKIDDIVAFKAYPSRFFDYTNQFFGTDSPTVSTTQAFNNTIIGRYAGINLVQGYSNTAIGAWALGAGIDIVGNVAVGDGALAGLVSGYGGNTAIGSDTANSLIDATGSTFIGSGAGLLLSTSSYSVIIGDRAVGGTYGSVSANLLTVIGREAGMNIQNGANNNIIIGYRAANALTTGTNNIVLGHDINLQDNTWSNRLNIGNLIFGTGIDGTGTTLSSGNIGIGSTSPSAKLTVAGTFLATGTSTLATTTVTNLALAGAFRDTTNSAGTLGMVLQSTGTSTRWVATSTLGISGGGGTFLALSDTPSSYTANRVMFTNSGATALTDSANFTFDGSRLSTLNLAVTGTSTFTGTTTLATTTIAGIVQMGTTSVASRFNLDVNNYTAAGTAGLNRYYTSTNAASGTVQFGELAYSRLNTTGTTTYVGSMFRVEDSTTRGNIVRGLEVQTNRGSNTQGENTALAGFARTFGVRGFTSGDAGSVFEPAGGYFESGGTTQGNAIRGYSSTITTASLMSLFQDTSAFSGNGLTVNVGNGSGSFSGKFLDLQLAGVSKFSVASSGATYLLGDLSIHSTNTDPADNNVAGMYFGANGIASLNRTAGVAMNLGRSNDGSVLEFYSAGAVQGGVSIAGATVSYNAFTGSHFGLTGSTTYPMGTLLELSGANASYNNDAESEILYGMKETTTENSPLVIGSYLSVLEPSKAESTANPTLVMAVGNGAMWVADQGVDVVRGDYLISSNVAGHAERDPQTDANSYIIARASEDIAWDEVTTEINGVKHKRITVFFENFVRPNINLALIASSTVELADIESASLTGQFMAGLFAKLTTWFSSAQNGIEDMYANVFNAKERICVDGECLTADDIRNLKGALQSGGSSNPPPSNGGAPGGNEPPPAGGGIGEVGGGESDDGESGGGETGDAPDEAPPGVGEGSGGNEPPSAGGETGSDGSEAGV